MFATNAISVLINLLQKIDSVGTSRADYRQSLIDALNQGLESPREQSASLSYTLSLGDKYKHLSFTGAALIAVPSNLPDGFECVVEQEGASALTFIASAGVTINSKDSALQTDGQYTLIYIRSKGNGVVGIYGNLV